MHEIRTSLCFIRGMQESFGAECGHGAVTYNVLIAGHSSARRASQAQSRAFFFFTKRYQTLNYHHESASTLASIFHHAEAQCLCSGNSES